MKIFKKLQWGNLLSQYIKMNKRFEELAKRWKAKTPPITQKEYPTPEMYSIPESVYRSHIRSVNEDNEKSLDLAINKIREAKAELYSSQNSLVTQSRIRDTRIAVVGSSLISTIYRDIDLVVVGFDETLADMFHAQLTSLLRDSVNNDFGNVSYGGFLVNRLTTRDIIDYVTNRDGKDFRQWHKMMVDRSDQYCLIREAK